MSSSNDLDLTALRIFGINGISMHGGLFNLFFAKCFIYYLNDSWEFCLLKYIEEATTFAIAFF